MDTDRQTDRYGLTARKTVWSTDKFSEQIFHEACQKVKKKYENISIYISEVQAHIFLYIINYPPWRGRRCGREGGVAFAVAQLKWHFVWRCQSCQLWAKCAILITGQCASERERGRERAADRGSEREGDSCRGGKLWRASWHLSRI